MSYCSECGALCNEVPTGKYSTETGAPITRPQCPTDKCNHVGVCHNWTMVERRRDETYTFYDRLETIWECRKCGWRVPDRVRWSILEP